QHPPTSSLFPYTTLVPIYDVAADWRDRIPAVVHVDGTARIQTVDPAVQPLLATLLTRFEQLTGLPVLVNTSLNTAGRPMVDSPTDRKSTRLHPSTDAHSDA